MLKKGTSLLINASCSAHLYYIVHRRVLSKRNVGIGWGQLSLLNSRSMTDNGWQDDITSMRH